MKLLVCRAWPAAQDVARLNWNGCVVDQLERIETSEYDYRPLRDRCMSGGFDGMLAFDWDIAFSLEDLRAMTGRARNRPDRGFVAPYWLYSHATWAHRRDGRWIDLGDAWCDLPGWGAIYVPAPLLRQWEPADTDPRLTDQNFGEWAKGRGLTWAVDWQIRVIHLNYRA